MRIRRGLVPLAVLALLLAVLALAPTAGARIENFTQIPSDRGTFVVIANYDVEITGVQPLSPQGIPIGEGWTLTPPVVLKAGERISGEMLHEKDSHKRRKPVFDALKLTVGQAATHKLNQVLGVEDADLLHYPTGGSGPRRPEPYHFYANITR